MAWTHPSPVIFHLSISSLATPSGPLPSSRLDGRNTASQFRLSGDRKPYYRSPYTRSLHIHALASVIKSSQVLGIATTPRRSSASLTYARTCRKSERGPRRRRAASLRSRSSRSPSLCSRTISRHPWGLWVYAHRSCRRHICSVLVSCRSLNTSLGLGVLEVSFGLFGWKGGLGPALHREWWTGLRSEQYGRDVSGQMSGSSFHALLT